MNQLWVEKYKPKKINDFILSFKNLQDIKKWITSEKKSKILILHGPPGIGKTTLANSILNENNYEVVEFNSSDVRNQKLISEKLNNILNKDSILSIMNNNRKCIGLIMDEIDGICSGEKSGLSEFIKLVNPKKNNFRNPIICTTNHINDKKVKEIIKFSNIIKIDTPKKNDMMKIIEKIENNENIDIDDSLKLNIISKSQNDLRRLVNILEYLYGHENNNVTLENINDLLNNFDKKDVDTFVFNSVDKILGNYNIEENTFLFESDKNIISLLLYENFLGEIIFNRKGDYKLKMECIKDTFSYFSESDMFDNNILLYHQKDLSNYTNIFKSCSVSYNINKLNKYSFKKKTDLDFSKLLNKTSLEYLNYKYLDEIFLKFNYYCGTDIHVELCDLIINKYMSNPNSIKEMFEKYNYDFNNIDKILKNSNSKVEIKELCNKKNAKKKVV